MTIENDIYKCFHAVDSQWYRRRLLGLMIAVLIAFGMLAARLFYLQIICGDHYYNLSKNNCVRMQRVNPVRGLMFDRSGKLLVENRPSFDLTVIPSDAKPVDETIKKLFQYIPEFADEIRETINKKKIGYGYKPVLLKRDIGRDALASISAHQFDLPGIVIEANARRDYIHPGLAAHLIGYLGEINVDEINENLYPDKKSGDVVGRFGVEKACDQYLSGVPGGRIVQVNANGQIVEVLDTVDPESGHNIFLTIDYDLQHTAETLLQGQVGVAIAMDPGTGEILAIANSPTFDQNDFIGGISTDNWRELMSDPDRPMLNRAIQGEYPPASTYKVVTAMAALGEGIISQHTAFFCPGSYNYGNRDYGCWKKHGHGSMDVVNALAQSCDVFFYYCGRKLGVDRLARYAENCGLGVQTGIGLDNEADGLIPTAAWKKKRIGTPWQGGENLSIAIGQGYNLVTPLQLLVLFSAIANGGTEFKPLIVKSVNTVEGHAVITGTPEVRGTLPVSHSNLELIRKGLLQAVNHPQGTARGYVFDGSIHISGKTGTAQVVSRRLEKEGVNKRGGNSFKSHAWFVGYAPSENPRIAVCVLIEHGEHGSSGAGPVAKGMMVSYLKNVLNKSSVQANP
ncbi:MAG: penicillin-binding protein 2 [Desulfosalsimonadaceae bacterium]